MKKKCECQEVQDIGFNTAVTMIVVIALMCLAYVIGLK